MKVYTLVITQNQESEVSLLNVIMKNDPAEIAKIIEDDYNEQVEMCTGEEDDDGNWVDYDESELITVTPEEIENDASWSYDCSNGGGGDLWVNYHVLVQRLEIKNDLVNLTNPAGE